MEENKVIEVGITVEQYNVAFKRIMRQLQERNQKVINGQAKENYYQNKRKEFVALIDRATSAGWFSMPNENTRIYKIYHNII